MYPWLKFLIERFPLPIYLPATAAWTLSGLLLSQQMLFPHFFFITFFLAALFLLLYRLIDEYMDYPRDIKAFPRRPLPKGIVKLSSVKRVTISLFCILLCLALLVSYLINFLAGIYYILALGYLVLISNDFFIYSWKTKRLFTKTLCKQALIFPLCLFCFNLPFASNIFSSQPVYWAISLYGSLVSFEICRKLHSKYPKEDQNYLHKYGPRKTFLFLFLAWIPQAIGAYATQTYFFTYPFQIAVLICFALVWSKKTHYKLSHAMAALSLMVSLFSILLIQSL